VPEPTDRERAALANLDPSVKRAVDLARMLDDRYVDPLVGLVLPGAGDLITASAGVYLVWVAIQRGLPAVVVARMLLNLAIDMVLGAVPALGDLFDFAFKANKHNARLLERTEPGKSTRGDWITVIGAGTLFLLALAIPITLLVWTLTAIFK
jgi:hypothetical protein